MQRKWLYTKEEMNLFYDEKVTSRLNLLTEASKTRAKSRTKTELLTGYKEKRLRDFEQNLQIPVKALSSVNEDLDSFYEDIRFGDFKEEKKRTFFLQKLTDEEIELVERNDLTKAIYFFAWNALDPYPDVDEERMKASNSDAKYLYAECLRKSSIINQSFATKDSCCSIIFSNFKSFFGIADKSTQRFTTL